MRERDRKRETDEQTKLIKFINYLHIANSRFKGYHSNLFPHFKRFRIFIYIRTLYVSFFYFFILHVINTFLCQRIMDVFFSNFILHAFFTL